MSSVVNRSKLREVKSIQTWLYCFLAYVTIRCPDKSTRALLTYARLLLRQAAQMGGDGWLAFDYISGRTLVPRGVVLLPESVAGCPSAGARRVMCHRFAAPGTQEDISTLGLATSLTFAVSASKLAMSQHIHLRNASHQQSPLHLRVGVIRLSHPKSLALNYIICMCVYS